MHKARLLHVGYPKCMSSTLQRDFFAKHPEIAFVGWGVPEVEHGWVDDEMASLCEVGIRYEKTLSYDPSTAKKIFERHLRKFEDNPQKKLFCLSSESFSFTMHFDVDPSIKAERLKDLMGDDTRILIVIRNQLDLFRSYHFECIRGGYWGYFNEFLDFHYHYLFHSILSDLRYYQLYELYCRIFGRENVKVIAMESLIQNPALMLRDLCTYSGITHSEIALSRHNDSDDKKYLQAVRLLNEKFPNNRGTTYFGWVDGEKLSAYWRVSRKLTEPDASLRNYGQRMLVFRSAKATVSDFVGPLDATYPANWVRMLNELYAENNASLAKATGIDLKTLGYPYI